MRSTLYLKFIIMYIIFGFLLPPVFIRRPPVLQMTICRDIFPKRFPQATSICSFPESKDSLMPPSGL